MEDKRPYFCFHSSGAGGVRGYMGYGSNRGKYKHRDTIYKVSNCAKALVFGPFFFRGRHPDLRRKLVSRDRPVGMGESCKNKRKWRLDRDYAST